jgi:hypothetical protein
VLAINKTDTMIELPVKWGLDNLTATPSDCRETARFGDSPEKLLCAGPIAGTPHATALSF